jgi:hypothetical protein
MDKDYKRTLEQGPFFKSRTQIVSGFIALNSPTLIEAMANIQRFYKVRREGHDCEIERFGPQEHAYGRT